MDISKYDLVIKRHVFERALQRGIHPDMIEDTLLKGKMKRFGKHGIKFVSKGSKRTIICVGELIGNKLKIITIEEGN
ncbi:DUF4258 domain-containing protein [Candidatus Woesearchaeota archaeon]|nr:DUF4258 domain-containing protein [Candidatus Woesearchaeota archaeon]